MTETTTREIPRYEVLELLGEGALATVHKVRAFKDGSIRALKTLKPEQVETERTIARFEDEYRILSALHFPNLPEVYDYGVSPEGAPYMVMEYLEGLPLDGYVHENPNDLWLLLFQLNEALAFIHEHNLLHLDLKPSNVLVRRTKTFGDEEMPLAMLIDFGLSYRRETGSKVKLVGTPGYMAPEIIRGEDRLTRAVDYYSLGVIIYELIEGKLPFRGSVHDILRGHLIESVTFDAQKIEYTELYPWVEKLMSKEPRERLQAFQEFRRAIAARLGETASKLERVLALGYIESLGLLGKEEAWEELSTWVSKLSEGLASRVSKSGAREIAEADVTKPARASKDTGVADVLKGSVSDLEARIEKDLLASAAPSLEADRRDRPIREIPRVLALTGPPESGKSHLLAALKTELQVRGVEVFSLGRESDYDTFARRGAKARRGRSQQVDPSSLVVDRFVTVWDQLSQMGRHAGVVVVVDDLDRASVEETEFVEYMGKRVGHEIAGGTEPGVFVVAVGRRSDVKSALFPVAAKEGAMTGLEVPPPGREDAETIAGRFRGSLSGAKEEKALASYLQANLQTSAALHQSLKRAITEGALVRNHGRWEFHERLATPLEATGTTAAYYQGIVQELSGAARRLVAVLACHPSALSSEELASVSGLSGVEIDEAIETVRPYRIIGIAETEHDRRVDVISDQVREGLRRALGKAESRRIHETYVGYFAGRAKSTVSDFEIMGHHYERLGRARDALLMRVRALACARKAQDVFALRRLCDRGVEYVRGLRSREWSGRKWLIERYFIKQWIDAEWMVTNYGNLVKVVRDHFHRRKRQVPVSFLYKYATALERTGDIEGSKKVLAEGKRRVKNKRSETYYLLVLEEGNVLYLGQRPADSLKRLDEIPPSSLSPDDRARLWVIYMLGHYALGNNVRSRHYALLASNLSVSTGRVEHLLRVKYGEIMSFLNAAQYGRAKRSAREAIRTASRHKLYRSLCLTLFMTSAVYYEEAKYSHAIRYLDRAIRIALDNGMEEQVNEYLLRYAMIYQNIGRYGDAIACAQAVFHRIDPSRAFEQLFYSLLVLMELMLLVHSPRAKALAKSLRKMSGKVRSRYRVALYHKLMGDYYRGQGQHEQALTEYRRAEETYTEIGYEDDLVRTEIARAEILIEKGEARDALALVQNLSRRIRGMQSRDIWAEYCILNLKFYHTKPTRDHPPDEYVSECERISSEVGDVRIAMKVQAALFDAYERSGKAAAARESFARYYSLVRRVVANLPEGEYLKGFTNDPDFQKLVNAFKQLCRKPWSATA